jgi:hypothetical protein
LNQRGFLTWNQRGQKKEQYFSKDERKRVINTESDIQRKLKEKSIFLQKRKTKTIFH